MFAVVVFILIFSQLHAIYSFINRASIHPPYRSFVTNILDTSHSLACSPSPDIVYQNQSAN